MDPKQRGPRREPGPVEGRAAASEVGRDRLALGEGPLRGAGERTVRLLGWYGQDDRARLLGPADGRRIRALGCSVGQTILGGPRKARRFYFGETRFSPCK